MATTRFRNYFPVSGRSASQGVFDRLSVQELEADHPYQWTLCVLGWAYIKYAPIPFPGVVQPPSCSITSYMELAAIHGKPYNEWTGDDRTPDEAKVDFNYSDKKDMNPSPSRFGGYCHHAAVTFPSWHRPYVMLVEQVIGEYAENIAQQIENSHPGEVGRWVSEAKKLRLPYWDWADPKVDIEGFPSLFYTDELTITATGQKPVTVPNPFTGFTFPFVPRDFGDITRNGVTAYFANWEKTYRYADPTPNPPGSNVQQLQATLKQRADGIRTSIGMLFTFPDNGNPASIYDEFSNTQNQSRQDGDHNNTGSLEGVHNFVHLTIGGNGHMAFPDYAAFDPIFFFHHCNIDRIIALWEWCYQDYWMGNGYTIDGTQYGWTLGKGTYTEAYSQVLQEEGEWGALAPFRNPDGTYWTPKQTRFLTPDVFPKYYSYKEFLGIKLDKAPASLKERQEARAKIAKYYSVDPQVAVSSIHAPSWAHISVTTPREGDLPPNYQPIPNFRIFKVLVRLHEHALGSSYNFNLYYKEELVGSVAVFARENNSPCKACAVRRAADTIIRGVITIPSRIINDIIVHSSIPASQNTMVTTTDLIARALSGKLEDPQGQVIATAQGGAAAAPIPAEQTAPRAIYPAEVSLLSAAVAEDVADEKQPVHFFDWQRHVDLFPSGWKAASPQQAQAPAAH